MPKFPIEITPGGKTIEAQEFADGEERVLIIGERMFRIWPLDDGRCYTMVKVYNTKRSLKGKLEDVRQVIANIHDVYRRYDQRVRKAKADAQRTRDAELSKLVGEVP